jgi:aldehyde dehydrogenase (NAD+)
MYEYLRSTPPPAARALREGGAAGSPRPAGLESHGRQSSDSEEVPPLALQARAGQFPSIDRTPKLYVGGKQVRPDSGYALPISAADGAYLSEVGRGNRKDIRNAVEAAHAAASKWARATAHNRSQVLYFLAENLEARGVEFAERLRLLTGQDGRAEVEASVRRCFTWAAWADKYDGAVHHTPVRNVTLAMPEPIGVIGMIAPDESPLLALLSLVLPAVAMGNAVVVVPSERWPLLATDLYQVFDTSDVPGGVVNIVTGMRSELLTPLAGHDDVDAIWVHGTQAEAAEAEKLSTGNMKRTWTDWTMRDWASEAEGEGNEFLRHATQVKNIWVPYGA